MKIIGANITGSFILNSQDVTTTIQTSNVWSGSVATDITALNAATASLLSYTASNNAAISDILLETASINLATASLLSYTASQNDRNGTYATTGSNTFTGIQTVNSNLVVTGSITAQTLVVQTITSSQDFVTGSTKFGSLLANTHQFTGSVIVTGSLNATAFTGSGAGLTSIPNAALSNSTISGIALGSNLATLTIGTGLSGTSYNGSGAVTIANSGVTSIVAGTNISISGATGAVTITNGITNNNQLTNGAGYITGAGTSADSNLLNGISAVNLYNNMGAAHSTRQSFDASTPSYGFGYRYVQGSTNGPGTGGGAPGQFYSWYIGLGTDYPATGAGSYGAMFAIDRNSTTPYLSIRYNENNSFSSWRKVYAGYADTLAGGSTITGTLNMATSGTNYIRMGVFPNSTTNTGEAWIGRASDRNAGTMTVQLGGNSASSRSFEVVDYAWSVVLFSVGSNGNATASGDVTAYSDARIKTNIKPIDSSLEKVLKLTGVTYNRTDLEDKSTKIGFIAQEIEKVVPEVVTYDGEKDKYSVSYGNVTALLVEAIKEQQSQIEELKTIINGLTK